MTAAEHESDIKFTTDSPYSALVDWLWDVCCEEMDQFQISQNAPVPYPTMLHSEQKCAHFCSELSIMGYGTGAFWDLWIGSIAEIWPHYNGTALYTTGWETLFWSVKDNIKAHLGSSPTVIYHSLTHRSRRELCRCKKSMQLTHWSLNEMAVISQPVFSNTHIFHKEKFCILIQILLMFVLKDLINNKPSFVPCPGKK